MIRPSPDDLTRLLEGVSAGDDTSTEALMPLVYEELRRLAGARMAAEPAGHTLQPTALVHEAYIRLLGDQDVRWESRGHFFAAAAIAMRRILIERARRKAGPQQGGGRARISLDDVNPAAPDTSDDLLAIDEALTRLESIDKRKADVVMLRCFAGLSVEETARSLDISPATVKADWSFARAWLRTQVVSEP